MFEEKAAVVLLSLLRSFFSRTFWKLRSDLGRKLTTCSSCKTRVWTPNRSRLVSDPEASWWTSLPDEQTFEQEESIVLSKQQRVDTAGSYKSPPAGTRTSELDLDLELS